MSLRLLTLMVLLTPGAKALAGGPEGVPVRVQERRLGQLYLIQGSLSTSASAQTAWEVLTAYGTLPSFVSSIRRSTVLGRRGSHVEVEQEVHAQVLFISRDMRLRLVIQETPDRHIDFRDVLGSDFDVYSGSWDVISRGSHTQLLYRLRLILRGTLPAGIGDGALRSSAERLLGELGEELLRRSQANLAHTRPRSP